MGHSSQMGKLFRCWVDQKIIMMGRWRKKWGRGKKWWKVRRGERREKRRWGRGGEREEKRKHLLYFLLFPNCLESLPAVGENEIHRELGWLNLNSWVLIVDKECCLPFQETKDVEALKPSATTAAPVGVPLGEFRMGKNRILALGSSGAYQRNNFRKPSLGLPWWRSGWESAC